MENHQQKLLRRSENKKMKHLTKLVLVIIILANFGYSQTVESEIDALFSRYNSQTPGVSVAVVKDGKIIFKKGYGMANLEYDIPITTKTGFNIASVSKQFTAFAVYLLEKQGKISLEDDVRKYIPEVPNFGKPIKIRHLIAHTSGLRDQWALLNLAGWRMDDVITTEHILNIIGKQKELNFEPGSQYSYCNSGFTLAAEIVARVSGKTFAEFTKENIFNPLGMNDSQFYDNAEKIIKNQTYSYEIVSGVYQKRNLNNFTAGPSNLITTVEDLSKWTLNFEKPVVGDAAMIEKFNQPSLLNNGKRAVAYVDGDDIGYHAKGQNVRIYRGANVLSHGGHTAGFRITFWRFPDQRFALILLSNDEHFELLNKAEAIADYYLKDVLKEKKVVEATEITKPTEKFTNNLKDFEGEFYSEELTTSYFLKAEDGKLIMSHTRLSDVKLTEIGKDKFSGSGDTIFSFEMEFLRNKKGEFIGLEISNFGAKNVKFTKVK
jgi:CubicO group peptidase (beta-lactamase class C family)